MRRIDLLIVSIVFILVSCHNKGKEGSGKLENKDIEELVAALTEMHVSDISTFYTKASTNYTDSSRNVNFKTSIRSIQDSIVNVDIKYSAIPLVNAVVTVDSLKVVNRRDKCWILNSISALKEQFGMEFSLDDLEDLLLGRPLNFDPVVEYHQLEDDNFYVLSSHSKKEIKKIAKDKEEALVIRYFISPDLQQLKRVIVESTKDEAIIVVEYKGYELVGKTLLPIGLKVDIKIGSRAPMYFEMDYSKTRINEKEDIYFVIPDGYENCMVE